MTIPCSFPFSCSATMVMLGMTLSGGVKAVEPIPVITELAYVSGQLTMDLGNLGAGGTYFIERTTDLSAGPWLQRFSFEGNASTFTWMDLNIDGHDAAFYRVIREPYHASVGHEGALVTRYHGVTGQARIVNNRTIEITSFNFDGQGIVVQIYLSPTPNIFDPYVVLGDGANLVRATAYVDETLILEIPEGVDLDTYKYISVWCVAADVSFGDGVLLDPNAP